MTFSILAKDPDSDCIGAAVATGNLAVGSRVLNAIPGVGIIATQGYSGSTLWAEAILSQLNSDQRNDDKTSPEEILNRVISSDTGKERRQITVMDQQGRTAAFTGKDNLDAMDQLVEPNLVVAGNWLTDRAVLTTLRDTFVSSTDQPFAQRLMAGLSAAADLGGDSRGVMSAAIKIVSPSTPATDLRIDFSEDPVGDLHSLLQRTNNETYQTFLSRLPTHTNPHNS